ncbi:MAG: hypothetical protein HYX54_02445 [Chloroflexi bacterium]|nr:hypothetical protein [Chloroflexota bacterium]
MRRRKVTYPPAKTATKGPPPVLGTNDPRNPAGRTVSINLDAIGGRASIGLGDKVRILSGLYAGEAAVVESEAGGVIPAVMVRTESGRTRRSRTIDLEPIRPGSHPVISSEEHPIEP